MCIILLLNNNLLTNIININMKLKYIDFEDNTYFTIMHNTYYMLNLGIKFILLVKEILIRNIYVFF